MDSALFFVLTQGFAMLTLRSGVSVSDPAPIV